ncbi:3-oxoacyl-(acyl-carrier-protein) synthase 3 [Streptomyces bingchenggensis BCW-1]|uniref:3-oxoacyl-(Acyl-carrier-protein) synthase 3 n=1 Tax=Streptomyces bingchenggensis (strain BCW-1) TaxID=749414 RepID=D7CC04_STRBB|nr:MULTISPECIES: beta-ketoacyl-ACP synthase 3 [Streptomyces]ADI04499.1 3-oxoacyl-(acyl-carrier-protein) synthase 3 [Streptomyces bingchenggensis BCW-1]
MNIGVLGTGSYLPAETVSNSLVAERAGVTDEWIVRKTGIRSRRYAAETEATSDLAVAAAESALRAAGIAAEQLSWVVVATSTPDHPQPATACLVQYRLGAHRAAAFDVNSVCSGFVFALETAARLLSPSRVPGPGPMPTAPGYALVIGADVYSRIIDRADRRTAVLFGDGAGAVVLGPVRPGRGLIGSRLTSHGDQHDLIHVEAGGSRLPASEKTLADGAHWFKMRGRAVSEFVARELPQAVRALLSTYGVDPARVDHFIPHQANGVMLRDAFPRLGLDRAKLHLTVDEHGNTSAASIPLALDTVCRAGAFRDGELLLLAGFGGGMSVGSALLHWDGDANPR